MVHWKIFLGLLMVVVAFSLALAVPFYYGFSGAPGSSGTCASTCHGQPGGTIEISGFPTEYVPDSTYVLAISHNGGDMISQFNASCRIGEGSENAGILAGGTNTETYSAANETNGIHFVSEDQDNGTFEWTAPSGGTGEVRLYVAGLQGGFDGFNTALVLSSTQLVACGDSNGDGAVNIFDITYVISFLYLGGPPPVSLDKADVNGDTLVNIFDATYLISFLYLGGPAPACL